MIKFFIPGYDSKRASYRFRAKIPLQGMRPGDGIIRNLKEATKDDIVVLAKKSTPKDLFYLKEQGIKCVYDICDNKWKKQISPDWVDRVIKPHNVICANANAIVTTCLSMQELIRKYVGRDSIIIEDPVEAIREEPRIALKSRRYINIFTFGNSKHFDKIMWNDLIKIFTEAELQFKIIAMIDRSKKYIKMYSDQIVNGRMEIYEFDLKKQYELMKEADIVFLPIVINSKSAISHIKGKSPNRIMDALYSGKPVITNHGVDTWNQFRKYAEFVGFARSINYVAFANTFKMLINMRKSDISKKIIEGQNYIRDYHTPEIIGKRWIDLENKVGRTGF
tara:strand:- start:48 stop:1052 length:1005 start_codon:yes stop_codon:yes gene_type:complete